MLRMLLAELDELLGLVNFPTRRVPGLPCLLEPSLRLGLLCLGCPQGSVEGPKQALVAPLVGLGHALLFALPRSELFLRPGELPFRFSHAPPGLEVLLGLPSGKEVLHLKVI